MTLEPAIYNMNMHKGVPFLFQFRFKENSLPKNITGMTVSFRAGYNPSEDDWFYFKTTDVSPKITVDAGDDYLVTVRIPETDTIKVPFPTLEYDIDLDDGATPTRWLKGTIVVKDQA